MCNHCITKKGQHQNIATLAYSGYHWCRSCGRVCEPTGEIHKRCNHCRSYGVQWVGPVDKPTGKPILKLNT